MVALARFFSPTKHGRVLFHLEVPFRFRNTLSKAGDPHINALTLLRHLRSNDPKIRNTAVENVLKRQPSSPNLGLFGAVLEGSFSEQVKDRTLSVLHIYLNADIKTRDKEMTFEMLAKQSIEIVRKFHDQWTQNGKKPAKLPKTRLYDEAGKAWPIKIEYSVGRWFVDKTDRLQPVYQNIEAVELFEKDWMHSPPPSRWRVVGSMIDDRLFMF